MIRLSIEEMQKYPYPNLMAEIVESHYSICTIGEHLELGKYLPENSPEIWDKLAGRTEILATEAFKLAKLFGANLEYLFSHKLEMLDDKPYAYWRWLGENVRRKRELEEDRIRQKIDMELSKRPYLLELVSKIVSMGEEEAAFFSDYIERRCGMKDFEVKEGCDVGKDKNIV